jgi:hypothetical protein
MVIAGYISHLFFSDLVCLNSIVTEKYIGVYGSPSHTLFQSDSFFLDIF